MEVLQYLDPYVVFFSSSAAFPCIITEDAVTLVCVPVCRRPSTS